MAKQTINVGTSANAGDGEGLRDAFIKTNSNFDEVYTDLDTKVDQGSITTSGLTMTGPALVGRTASTSGAVAALNSTSVKSMLALDQVNNTADADKPISTAAQTALNSKEPTIAAGTTGQYWKGDKTWATLNKAAVGLANVDNTTDADKPISSATQTALNGKAATTHTHVPADIQMATQRLLGRNTTGSGAAEELTSTQVKSVIGLSNVNNTADADKPISTLTQAALDGKAATVHTHAISDVTGLQSELDNKMNVGGAFGVENIEGLQAALDLKLESDDLATGLATKANTVHTHVAADITDLLDVVAAKTHSHEIEDVNGLQGELDGKSPTGHGHAIADITGLQTALDTLQDNIDAVEVSETPQVFAVQTFLIVEPVTNMAISNFTIVLANSIAIADEPGDIDLIFPIKKNGVTIGTVTFLSGSTTGTIDIPVSADLSLTVGDYLVFSTPDFEQGVDTTPSRARVVLRN
jgi:hypothetical protein